MVSRCERRGQLEIGIIDHEGRIYAAFGASINGHNITAYTGQHQGRLALTTWGGKVMLACRSEVIREFCGGTMAIVFKFTHRRFIVGYALGNEGMLFRGELMTHCDDEMARREAIALAAYWSQIDAEDEADPCHGEPDENALEDW
jgi:hypothetical protein